jgi:lysophospholipase L1-like esterase
MTVKARLYMRLAGLLAILVASCGRGTPVAPATQPRATETQLPSTPTDAGATSTDAAGGASEAWDYVALGDSFTAVATWPEIYASTMEEELGVEVTLHREARPGQRASDALLRIQTDDRLRRLIMEAEVITVNVGANSLEYPFRQYEAGTCGGEDGQDCLRSAVASVEADWSALLDELVALRGPEEAHIVTFRFGSWLPQVICDWGSECWEVLLGYLLTFNDSVERAANERGIHVVDVNPPFVGADYRQPVNREYVVSDGIHVSEDGSVVITDLLLELGLPQGVP